MLEQSQVLAYVTVLSLAAIIPGPGMTALVANSVRGGAITGFSMLTGLIIGDLLYLSFAVFGLSMMVQSFDGIFNIISLLSALYLSYLSIQFWRYNPEIIDVNDKHYRTELLSAAASGLSITLGNPKTIAFYLAILPLVIQLDTVSVKIWGLMLVPLTVAVLIVVGAIFIFGAVKIRYLLASSKAQHLLFKSAGVVMFIAALTMIVKTL